MLPSDVRFNAKEGVAVGKTELFIRSPLVSSPFFSWEASPSLQPSYRHPIPVGSNPPLHPPTRNVFLPVELGIPSTCTHKYVARSEVLSLDLWRHAGQHLCFLVLAAERLNCDALDSCQVRFSPPLLGTRPQHLGTEQPTWSCSLISPLRREKQNG